MTGWGSIPESAPVCSIPHITLCTATPQTLALNQFEWKFHVPCPKWMDLIKQSYRAFIHIMRNFSLELENGGAKQFHLSKSTCWPWARCKVITGSGDEEIQAISPESLGNAANKVSVNDQTHCSLHTHIPARAHTHTQTDGHSQTHKHWWTHKPQRELTHQRARTRTTNTHTRMLTHTPSHTLTRVWIQASNPPPKPL